FERAAAIRIAGTRPRALLPLMPRHAAQPANVLIGVVRRHPPECAVREPAPDTITPNVRSPITSIDVTEDDERPRTTLAASRSKNTVVRRRKTREGSSARTAVSAFTGR